MRMVIELDDRSPGAQAPAVRTPHAGDAGAGPADPPATGLGTVDGAAGTAAEGGAQDAGPSAVATADRSTVSTGEQDAGPPPTWLVEEIDRLRAHGGEGADAVGAGAEQDGGAGPTGDTETEQS